MSFEEFFEQVNTDKLFTLDAWKCLINASYKPVGSTRFVGLSKRDWDVLLAGGGIVNDEDASDAPLNPDVPFFVQAILKR